MAKNEVPAESDVIKSCVSGLQKVDKISFFFICFHSSSNYYFQ